MSPISQNDLQRWFTYQPPTDDQIPKYNAIRQAALEFAKVLVANTPAGDEQRDAIDRVRIAVMVANQAVAFQKT